MLTFPCGTGGKGGSGCGLLWGVGHMLTFPWLSGGPRLLARGVGHKPEAVPAMGRPDTASWQYCRSESVALAFQVMSGLVQPFMDNRRRNLLSKNCWRFALADEPEPYWPKLAFVGSPFLLSGKAEGLEGVTTGPDGSIVGPTCDSEGDGPSTDSGEVVTLGEALEVIGIQLRDGARVLIAPRKVALQYQVAKPLGGVGVDLVVKGCGYP